jgi:hypothetical protein
VGFGAVSHSPQNFADQNSIVFNPFLGGAWQNVMKHFVDNGYQSFRITDVWIYIDGLLLMITEPLDQTAIETQFIWRNVSINSWYFHNSLIGITFFG